MCGITTGNRSRAGIAAAMALLLMACGQSGDVAGIQGSGLVSPAAVTTGPISGFGSVFVGGVEYATSAAQIVIDGQTATEAQLQIGQVVTIHGTVNSDGISGAATALTFTGDVQGPVSQVDLVGNTFTVLGQTVRVTASTTLDASIQPADLTGLPSSAVVEVSGFADPAGEIVASRVDVKAAGSGLQLKGVVQGLDTTAHTFQINGFVVDYSAATSAPALSSGDTVVAHGSALIPSGALLARHLEVLPGLGANANERADLDGLITTFTSSSDFALGGQRVAAGASTVLVLHGLTLATGVEVDVKGTFDTYGVLQAQKIEAKPFSSGLAAGLVDSVNASTNTLSVLGVNINAGIATAFEDRSSQHVRTFRLTDLHTGDYVVVGGTESTPGTLDAATLVRENLTSRSYLQGTARNVAQPNFTVLGVTVTTTAQTRFAGPGGAANGAATFFSQASNRLVRVSGSYSGGVLTATQVQLAQ